MQGSSSREEKLNAGMQKLQSFKKKRERSSVGSSPMHGMRESLDTPGSGYGQDAFQTPISTPTSPLSRLARNSIALDASFDQLPPSAIPLSEVPHEYSYEDRFDVTMSTPSALGISKHSTPHRASLHTQQPTLHPPVFNDLPSAQSTTAPLLSSASTSSIEGASMSPPSPPATAPMLSTTTTSSQTAAPLAIYYPEEEFNAIDERIQQVQQTLTEEEDPVHALALLADLRDEKCRQLEDYVYYLQDNIASLLEKQQQQQQKEKEEAEKVKEVKEEEKATSLSSPSTEDLAQQLQTLHVAYDEERQKSSEFDAYLQELTQEADALKHERALLQQQLRDLAQSVTAQEDWRAQTLSQQQQQETQLSELQSQYAQVLNDLNKEHDLIAILKLQHTRAQQHSDAQLQSLQSQLADSLQEKETLTAQAASDRTAVQLQLAALQSQLTQQQSNVSSLQETLDTQTRQHTLECEQQAARIHTLQHELQSLQEKKELAEREAIERELAERELAEKESTEFSEKAPPRSTDTSDVEFDERPSMLRQQIVELEQQLQAREIAAHETLAELAELRDKAWMAANALQVIKDEQALLHQHLKRSEEERDAAERRAQDALRAKQQWLNEQETERRERAAQLDSTLQTVMEERDASRASLAVNERRLSECQRALHDLQTLFEELERDFGALQATRQNEQTARRQQKDAERAALHAALTESTQRMETQLKERESGLLRERDHWLQQWQTLTEKREKEREDMVQLQQEHVRCTLAIERAQERANALLESEGALRAQLTHSEARSEVAQRSAAQFDAFLRELTETTASETPSSESMMASLRDALFLLRAQHAQTRALLLQALQQADSEEKDVVALTQRVLAQRATSEEAKMTMLVRQARLFKAECLREAGFRVDLVFQKRFLMLVLGGDARALDRALGRTLGQRVPPRRRWRAAVWAVVAVQRMKITCRRWHKVRELRRQLIEEKA